MAAAVLQLVTQGPSKMSSSSPCSCSHSCSCSPLCCLSGRHSDVISSSPSLLPSSDTRPNLVTPAQTSRRLCHPACTQATSPLRHCPPPTTRCSGARSWGLCSDTSSSSARPCMHNVVGGITDHCRRVGSVQDASMGARIREVFASRRELIPSGSQAMQCRGMVCISTNIREWVSEASADCQPLFVGGEASQRPSGSESELLTHPRLVVGYGHLVRSMCRGVAGDHKPGSATHVELLSPCFLPRLTTTLGFRLDHTGTPCNLQSLGVPLNILLRTAQ